MNRVVSIDEVIEATAAFFNMPVEVIKNTEIVTRDVTGPRHIAMYLARRVTYKAMAEIGEHFGRNKGENHRGVWHAFDKVSKLLASNDGPTCQAVEAILSKLEDTEAA